MLGSTWDHMYSIRISYMYCNLDQEDIVEIDQEDVLKEIKRMY